VAHRGVLWAASAEAPALTTPPGTLGIEFDTPGYKHQIWNLGPAFTHPRGEGTFFINHVQPSHNGYM
jgi:hypothetical protein